MEITNLFRYPIKGLGAEELDSTVLEADHGLPGDRQYAIIHGSSKFNPENPSWVHRRNFVSIARSPQMCRARFSRLPANGTSISDTNSRPLQVTIDSETLLFETDDSQPSPQPLGSHALNKLLQATQPGPYSLVKTSGYSLWDAPFAGITLMNKATLQDLADAAGVDPDPDRFRGNIWISGVAAWEELNWVGSTLAANTSSMIDGRPQKMQLRVVEPIQRCRAINTHPRLGTLDANLTRQILDTQNHCYFGVHAEVIATGEIRTGDQLILNKNTISEKASFNPPF